MFKYTVNCLHVHLPSDLLFDSFVNRYIFISYSSRCVNIEEKNKYNLRTQRMFSTNSFMLQLHRQPSSDCRKCKDSMCNKYI